MPPNAVAAPRMANSTPKLLPADSVSVPVTRASSNVSAGTDDSTIAPCEAASVINAVARRPLDWRIGQP